MFGGNLGGILLAGKLDILFRLFVWSICTECNLNYNSLPCALFSFSRTTECRRSKNPGSQFGVTHWGYAPGVSWGVILV